MHCLSTSMELLFSQEFPKARENYERFLELCKLLEDSEGEAVAYNFLGCNIQESQDLKLACQRDQIVLVQGAAIVDTQVQIEVSPSIMTNSFTITVL